MLLGQRIAGDQLKYVDIDSMFNPGTHIYIMRRNHLLFDSEKVCYQQVLHKLWCQVDLLSPGSNRRSIN